jgi:hypothetical protein
MIKARAGPAHATFPFDTGSDYPIQTDSASGTSINGVPFTLRCAIDQASRLKTATQHYYWGKPGTHSPEQMAEIVLSADRLAEWNTLYAHSLAGASGWPLVLPFRLTESSPFTNDKNPGNQIFATGLWGLDYFHWWARHGCAGIDPFARVVQFHSPIFQLSNRDFAAEPYAYGMKAFSLGSQGVTISAAGFQISNPDHINMTGCAVSSHSE